MSNNPIVVGVSFIITGPLCAIIAAVVFGLMLHASFSVVFYSVWVGMSVLGVLSIIGGILEWRENRKGNSHA